MRRFVSSSQVTALVSSAVRMLTARNEYCHHATALLQPTAVPILAVPDAFIFGGVDGRPHARKRLHQRRSNTGRSQRSSKGRTRDGSRVRSSHGFET